MNIHPRSTRLETENAFKVLARAQQLEAGGRDIVHLEIGQPDFPTPEHIREAAIQAIRDGKTGYVPAPGIPPLREAIAADAGRRRGLEFSAEQVIVTPGAKPIMLYTIQSLVGEGDEVIYPDPGFPMYRSLISHSGARGPAGATPRAMSMIRSMRVSSIPVSSVRSPPHSIGCRSPDGPQAR